MYFAIQVVESAGYKFIPIIKFKCNHVICMYIRRSTPCLKSLLENRPELNTI